MKPGWEKGIERRGRGRLKYVIHKKWA